MRSFFCAAAAIILTFSLTACGMNAPVDDMLPGRMVSIIEISPRPYDETLDRCYTDKGSLAPIIRMLREMDTEEVVEELPQTDLAQDICTITATYANGTTETYCILEEQYLRRGEDDWHLIDPEQYQELEQFIRDTPSDK